MATQTSNGVITLTPTRWKWVIGALFMLLVPGVGFFLAALFFAIAFGSMHRLVLKSHGFEVRHWGKSAEYRWDEVGSFDVRTFRYMFIPVVRRITFTPIAKEGTLMTRATKVLGGGTERVPVIGMDAPKLVAMMNRYRDAYVAEYGIKSLPVPDAFSPTDGLREAQTKQPKPRTEPAPIYERKQAVEPKRARKSAGLEHLGKGLGQDPLVQDSLMRKWRTRD